MAKCDSKEIFLRKEQFSTRFYKVLGKIYVRKISDQGAIFVDSLQRVNNFALRSATMHVNRTWNLYKIFKFMQNFFD